MTARPGPAGTSVMRIDVAPVLETADPRRLAGAAVLVVDVFRATTTMVTAIANGCLGIVPAADETAARAIATRLGDGALLAGEQDGHPIRGFDLSNSPLDYRPERVRDRTVIMTTTNGTRALLAAHPADSIAVLALVNLTAAVDWAARQERRIVILCAGDRGATALEDTVCAGLAAGRLAACMKGTLGHEALWAVESAAPYAQAVGALRATSPWARGLEERGLAGDVEACLTADAFDVVPVYHPARGIVTR